MSRFPVSRITVVGALIVALTLTLTSSFASGAQRTTPTTDTTSSARATVPVVTLDANAARVPVPASGGHIADVIAAGKLVVGVVSVDRYPFFYTDAGGNLAGSDIDLAKDIAKELGVQATFNRNATTFDGVVDLVAKGDADIGISKLSVTLPRAQKTRFTKPYIELAQGLMLNRVELTAAHADPSDLIGLANQPGRKIGAVTGTSYVGFGKQIFPAAQIVEYGDKAALFGAVINGDVLGVLYDENEIKQYIFEKPDRLIEVKVQMLAHHTDPIAISVVDPQMQYWLDTYLELKAVKLSVNDLLKKYARPEGK